MSQDQGNVANGYVNNFAYGTISLDSGAQVTLVNQYTNSSGPSPECVYVNSLFVPSGDTLNLNGLHLYARLFQTRRHCHSTVLFPNCRAAAARSHSTPRSVAPFLPLEHWINGHSSDALVNT